MREDKKEWDFIYTYTRKQSIEDGLQVEANPQTRDEAGIKYPVFLTTTVYDRYVKLPEGCEDTEDLRLWDIFTMFKHYTKVTPNVTDFLKFKVSVFIPTNIDLLPNEVIEYTNQRLVTLHALIVALDFDDPQPSITIMLPNED